MAVTVPGANRQRDLIVGIRVVGEGDHSSCQQLADTVAFVREQGNGGHVLWFRRGGKL